MDKNDLGHSKATGNIDAFGIDISVDAPPDTDPSIGSTGSDTGSNNPSTGNSGSGDIRSNNPNSGGASPGTSDTNIGGDNSNSPSPTNATPSNSSSDIGDGTGTGSGINNSGNSGSVGSTPSNSPRLKQNQKLASTYLRNILTRYYRAERNWQRDLESRIVYRDEPYSLRNQLSRQRRYLRASLRGLGKLNWGFDTIVSLDVVLLFLVGPLVNFISDRYYSLDQRLVDRIVIISKYLAPLITFILSREFLALLITLVVSLLMLALLNSIYFLLRKLPKIGARLLLLYADGVAGRAGILKWSNSLKFCLIWLNGILYLCMGHLMVALSTIGANIVSSVSTSLVGLVDRTLGAVSRSTSRVLALKSTLASKIIDSSRTKGLVLTLRKHETSPRTKKTGLPTESRGRSIRKHESSPRTKKTGLLAVFRISIDRILSRIRKRMARMSSGLSSRRSRDISSAASSRERTTSLGSRGNASTRAASLGNGIGNAGDSTVDSRASPSSRETRTNPRDSTENPTLSKNNPPRENSSLGTFPSNTNSISPLDSSGQKNLTNSLSHPETQKSTDSEKNGNSPSQNHYLPGDPALANLRNHNFDGLEALLNGVHRVLTGREGNIDLDGDGYSAGRRLGDETPKETSKEATPKETSKEVKNNPLGGEQPKVSAPPPTFSETKTKETGVSAGEDIIEASISMDLEKNEKPKSSNAFRNKFQQRREALQTSQENPPAPAKKPSRSRSLT
ncbi:MAG: hypothetical protein LBI70_02015 [Rickettsiales bacterium]|jgi:hypothetical protein|nr:hypothetical protein [Rickettsiales bacterium]